jgi:lipopolysaccharide transport system ATP-binding protein
MSSEELAVSVRGLGKSYQIYERPADRLKQFVMPRLQRRMGLPARQYFKEFWALRDISFQIPRGSTVGIVGRNGSGKSTLLQIICGTLSPTLGSVETNGRIAALLELGSGFNPEFSGRDNVYMNALLLGLDREAVDERFDSIAAFADIGEYMEQPVKTYSSGMFVRLAFAVIAHVDADILVVDEALAVGDAVFTQKCMRFIRRFQDKGTLLFVSHDPSAVQNLCRSALWLDRGILMLEGAAREVSQAYLKHSLQELYGGGVALRSVEGDGRKGEGPEPASQDQGTTDLPRDEAAGAEGAAIDAEGSVPPGAATEPAALDYGSRFSIEDNVAASPGFSTGAAEILSIELSALDGTSVATLAGGELVCLRILARANESLDAPIIGFIVKDRLGQDLFGENTLPFTTAKPHAAGPGQTLVAEFVFRLPMLPNGQYSVTASIANGTLHDNVQHHYLHEGLILTVASATVRWGLVGIPFQRVSLRVAD